DEDMPWLCFAYGRYLEEIGKLDQSRCFHEKGIRISQECGDLLSEALNKFGIGIALQRYDYVRDVKKAVLYLIEAAEFFEKKDSYQEANILMNLGSCYDRLGYSDRAINAYEKCISLLKIIENNFDLSRAYYSQGIAYINNNQLESAEVSFNQGKYYCFRSKNLYFMSHILYGTAWLEYRKKNFDKSHSLIEEAISSFNDYKENFLGNLQVSFYESEGNIYLLAGAINCKLEPIEKDRIDYYFDKAEFAYRQLDRNEKKIALVLANRARLYKKLKKWGKSIELLLKLFEKGKKIGNDSILSDASIHLLFIHWQKKASLVEWIAIIKRLGLRGCWYVSIGLSRRVFIFCMKRLNF
ncbi:MAG: tetratricopeptide repeat protein, partial [Bacteroidota bacterium]